MERASSLPTTVTNPNELSSALMKALRVGEDRKGGGEREGGREGEREGGREG